MVDYSVSELAFLFNYSVEMIANLLAKRSAAIIDTHIYQAKISARTLWSGGQSVGKLGTALFAVPILSTRLAVPLSTDELTSTCGYTDPINQ